MDNKKFKGIYVGWILLVTAAALVAMKMRLFTFGGTKSHWWALFLLIPIGAFGLRAVQHWPEDKRRSRNMIRVALFILPVLAASLYWPLWKVIYIPYIVVVGVDMILGSIIGSSEQK